MRCSIRLRARRIAITSSSLVVLLAFSANLSPRAHADIRVIKANGDPVPPEAYSITFNRKTSDYDVTLTERYNPNLESVFDIRANAGEVIANVFINVDGPAAGSPIIVKVQGEPPGFLTAVHNIEQNGTGETILTKVQVTQDVGSVTAEVIGEIIAGRDVIGPVIATTADNAIRGITSVQAVRDILGDCTADSGRILLIWAQRHIGSEVNPVVIRARHSVYQVMAEEVFADILTRHNGGTGGFWALVTNRFSGTLSTEKLILNPWNNLDARIAIYNQFDGVIAIGKNYNSAAQYIELPPPPIGFTGQIIVNADGAPNGLWSSPVRIGPNGHPGQIVLSAPQYALPAEQIGGGAVGLVPFRLHDEACVPANGSTAQLSPIDPPLTVQLRHYGPVNYAQSPITIERRAAGTQNVFVTVPLSNFSVSRSSGDRALTISAAPGQAGFEFGWQYRIRPTSALFCDISTAPPALAVPPTVVWDEDYLFTVVRPPCPGDINHDGATNVSDLLLVISFWGPAIPGLSGPDLNGDGVVNVSDLLIVIANWGQCW